MGGDKQVIAMYVKAVPAKFEEGANAQMEIVLGKSWDPGYLPSELEAQHYGPSNADNIVVFYYALN